VVTATYNPDGRQISDAVSGLNAFTAPVFPAEVDAPRAKLPDRGYFLLEGPLNAATDLGCTVSDAFFPQSPNLFWPQDHAWCVASEIDLYCTLVAGSEVMVEELLADSRLEAWRVEPDDPIAYDSDKSIHKVGTAIGGSMLVKLSLLLAIVASGVLCLAPTVATLSTPGPIGTRHVNLLESQGWSVTIPLAIPILIAALPLAPLPERLDAAARVASATLLSCFVMLGLLSIGIFYAPSTTVS